MILKTKQSRHTHKYGSAVDEFDPATMVKVPWHNRPWLPVVGGIYGLSPDGDTYLLEADKIRLVNPDDEREIIITHRSEVRQWRVTNEEAKH